MRMYQQALAIQRDIGERRYYAASLFSLGRVLRQKGDADEAKRSLEEGLSTLQQLGEKGGVAEDQLPLADLACDSGRPAEAETLARAAIGEFHREKATDNEILAGALLSRSLLQQGKLNEARQAIATALKLSEKSKDVTVRMPLGIQVAYFRAAAKDFRSADLAARQVLAQATRLGFVRIQFEASLALGEIEMKAGNRVAARIQLERVEQNARAKGFELIARKATAARA